MADGVDPALSAAGRTIDLAWTGTDGIVLQTHGKPPHVVGPGRFASLLARPDRTVIAWVLPTDSAPRMLIALATLAVHPNGGLDP